jgi:hypothetical protein
MKNKYWIAIFAVLFVLCLALVFLPPKTYFGIMKYERQIMFGLLISLLVLSYVFDFSPFGWIASKLTNLVTIPVANGIWSLLRSTLSF